MDKLLIIFTDLDGTFLDHETYSYEAAKPCLELILNNNIPLIFTSSKTAPEIEQLCRDTRNYHPFISENGGLISVPENYFPTLSSDKENFSNKLIGISRSNISIFLQKQKKFYNFSSFSEMGTDGIINATGLARSDASYANQRECTEPIQWQDTDTALNEFIEEVEKQGLQCIRGGRFYHIMGHHDKATTMTLLINEYKKYSDKDMISIALGDSPNDYKMLINADHGIVIPNPISPISKIEKHESIVYANFQGPSGWNESLLKLLKDYI